MEKSQAIWLGAERTICFKHSRMVREIWLQYCIVIENMTVTEGVMCSNVNCNQNATVKNNNNVLTYLAKSKFLFFLYIEPEQMYMRVKYHSILSETKTMYFFVPGFYYCQQLLSLAVCRMHSMRYFFFFALIQLQQQYLLCTIDWQALMWCHFPWTLQSEYMCL